MIDISKIKKGDKVRFQKGDKTILAKYFGRFDFLYCFETDEKMFPKVANLDEEKISLYIANFDLLAKYGMTIDEIKAILKHEEGHIISTGQKDKSGIDLEYDADEYAASYYVEDTLLSALNKSRDIIAKEGKKETKEENLGSMDKRITNMVRRKSKNKNIEIE